MIRQHEVHLRSLDPPLPPPVNLVRLVHPLEGAADSPRALDLALLQPDVIAAGYELPVARHASTIEPRS